MNHKRVIVAAAVVCIGVAPLVFLGGRAAANASPVWALPVFTGVCGFAMALVMVRLAKLAARQAAAGRERLFEEAGALNRHAMVSLTDSDALIFHVNEKLLETTGYAASELIGKPASVLYYEEDKFQFEGIRDGLNQGRAWTGETRIRCRDGRLVWTQATILPRLDRKGQLIGTISIRNDITAAKVDAEQKDLYSALHTMWDEVYMIDPHSLRFLYMNDAAKSRLGWDEAVYRGKRLSDDDTNFDEALFRERMAPLMSGETQHIDYTNEMAGTPYNISVQLITNFAGEQKLLAILRDMSEQVEADRARSELLATISHELRTPMTSIKGAMGLLLSSAAGNLPEKARDMLGIAYRNADRMVAIINDILDIEKIAAGQMEFDLKTAPLEDVIHEAVAANEQFANRFDVRVKAQDVDSGLYASYDFERTLQVLNNLLSNAAKFSPPGGLVEVSTSRHEGRVRVSVRDYGPGIPFEAQERVFERFQQVQGSTPRGVNGTGLGLNIAKVIMQEQNGDISLQSTPGKGSTFHIDFPAVVAPSAPDGTKEIGAVG